MQLGEAEPENLLAGAVQQQDAAGKIRSDESAAHRVNNVFREILEAEKLFPLLLQLPPFATKRLGQQAGQIGDGEKTEKVNDQPGAETFGSRRARVRARNSSCVGKKRHASEEDKAGRGDEEGYPAGKQNARDDNHQQVERDEITLLQAGGIDQQRNHSYIAGNLQSAMPAGLRNPAQENEVKNSNGDPEDKKRKKETIGTEIPDVLRPNHSDSQDQGDRQKTNTRQPVQPFPCREAFVHG